jgi:hypothetical protein
VVVTRTYEIGRLKRNFYFLRRVHEQARWLIYGIKHLKNLIPLRQSQCPIVELLLWYEVHRNSLLQISLHGWTFCVKTSSFWLVILRWTRSTRKNFGHEQNHYRSWGKSTQCTQIPAVTLREGEVCWTFLCILYYCQNKQRFLGALTKLRKANNSFVMSVRLSVRMEQLGYYWTDFHEIWYLSIYGESVEKIKVSSKSDKCNWYFTWGVYPFIITRNVSDNFRTENFMFSMPEERTGRKCLRICQKGKGSVG